MILLSTIQTAKEEDPDLISFFLILLVYFSLLVLMVHTFSLMILNESLTFKVSVKSEILHWNCELVFLTGCT